MDTEGGYRFDFNGKEKDPETELNDFGARFYAANIGRWLSIDPSAAKFPAWSPYNAMNDNPMRFVYPDGMESKWVPEIHKDTDANGKTTNAYLVLKAEEGDNAQTLAKAMQITENEAIELYSKHFDTKTGELGLPETIAPVKAIDNAIYNAYVSNPEDYGGSIFGNYDCFDSALAVSEGGKRFPMECVKVSKYIQVINNNYEEVTTVPKIGDVTSFKQYDVWGNLKTPHAASFIIKSKNGVNYYWSKNGCDYAPVIAT